jgi:hypothetical protein
MPRIALVVLCVLGGCSFEANYADGVYRCTDGMCPAPLVCEQNLDKDYVCRTERRDAAVDGSGDGSMGDAAPAHAMTCTDPQPLINNESFKSTTHDRSPKLATACLNRTMYGPDAVHAIEPGAGKTMTIKVDAAFAATAYVLSGCSQTACNGNVYATPGNPVSVYTLAGVHYVVVDSTAANVDGDYTLTVSY